MSRTHAVLALLVAGSTTSIAAAQQVVISQVYGGGNGTGATYKQDYVELRNRTGAPIDLTGWSIQYASATGSTWLKRDIPSGTIPANGYFLVQMSTAGTVGLDLPTPDVTAPSTINMAAAQGKVALVNNQTTITTGTVCPITGGFGVVDFVGYGVAGATNPCFEGTGSTGIALSATIAAFRNSGGCDDSQNNNLDFTNGTPAPRNSASLPGAACALNNPDLTVSVGASPNPAYVGTDVITYTLSVVNGGGGDAANGVLSFPIPSGVTSVNSVPAGVNNAGTWEIALGTVAANATVPVSIAVTPTTEGTITANFSVSTTSTEGNTSNNTASSSVLALDQANLVNVKISQVYPGGGTANTSVTYQRDYAELFNAGSTPVSLNGRSIQYQSDTGTSWTRLNLPSVTLAPGQYFLVGLGSTGTGGAPLPPIDATSTTISMSTTGGKLALVNATTNLIAGCVPTGATIIDFVGWGTANCAEGSAAAWPTGNLISALYRRGDGCTDTGDNFSDFLVTPTDPRGTSTIVPCSTPRADVTLSLSSNPTCQVATGLGALTLIANVGNVNTLTATDTVATITLPAGTTPVSASPSVGSANITGNVVTWNIGSVAFGGTPSLAITADVSGSGDLISTGSITTTALELNLGNNDASLKNYVGTPRTPTLVEVIATSVASAPSSKRVITTAGGGSGTLTGSTASSDTFGRPFGSPDGSKFVIRMDTDVLATSDQLVVVTTGATPTLTAVAEAGPGTVIGFQSPESLDDIASINDAGDVAFGGQFAGAPTASDQFVAKRSAGGVFRVIAVEASTALGLGGAVTFGPGLAVQAIDNAGNVMFASTSLGGAATTDNAYVGLSADGLTGTSLARKGVDSPTATAPLLANTYLNFDIASFSLLSGRSGDGLTNLLSGTLNNATTNDVSITVNGDVKIQEGAVIPGSGFAANVSSVFYNSLLGDGHWFAYGANVGTSANDWVVRDGAVIAASGTPAHSGATENWSDTAPLTPGSTGAYAQCFIAATGLGTSTVVTGVTDFPDGWSNGVAATPSRVLFREGDPLDLNGNGIDDDGAVVNTFRDDRQFVGADGYLYAVVSVRAASICGTPAIVELGQALVRVPLNGGATGCNLADITEVGGTEEFPGNPDGQLTVDDLILFVNLFSAGTNCPGTAPCNRADVTGIGGSGAAPDGELTVDDLIEFVNAFSSGC